MLKFGIMVKTERWFEMKQVNCPIDFNKITKDYDTEDLTIIYSEKEKPHFNGRCDWSRIPDVKRKFKGHWVRLPYISLNIGKNKYPYAMKDRYGVEFVAQTKEELILFLFWHEFHHYVDFKTGVKTKHREISEIAYNRVWGGL